MTSLPPELVEEILSHAVQPPNSRTSTVARVSSSFLAICQRLVYSHLHFTSRAQITSFISTYSNPDAGPRVPYCPRMFTVNLSGDESHLVFCDLQLLLSRCFSQGKGDTGSDNEGRLCLDLLRLRLNSHAFDVQIMMIHQALSLVHPTEFTWTGPDPPHHFSIAIVPQAIHHLFRALSSYTKLLHLKLSHLSMRSASAEPYTLPVIPSLETLQLGQVIFLDPSVIVDFIFNPNHSRLQKVHLVDAYTESIWGPRLRTADLENVAVEGLEEDAAAETGRTIRYLVTCEAKTERFEGGDRVQFAFI
ncbi:hypothetical protein D9619_009800 [Psilocybe cf. subviscida]|uniref:F-box domain-containing protein n=1 Tax=Psilocybe cf. subviscida TaxID=2480587 RepID=A0A8H5BKY8_9AGAR|nr:hypothetical protein D9619_009800 [Psilocybe cf. subviscida]